MVQRELIICWFGNEINITAVLLGYCDMVYHSPNTAYRNMKSYLDCLHARATSSSRLRQESWWRGIDNSKWRKRQIMKFQWRIRIILERPWWSDDQLNSWTVNVQLFFLLVKSVHAHSEMARSAYYKFHPFLCDSLCAHSRRLLHVQCIVQQHTVQWYPMIYGCPMSNYSSQTLLALGGNLNGWKHGFSAPEPNIRKQ